MHILGSTSLRLEKIFKSSRIHDSRPVVAAFGAFAEAAVGTLADCTGRNSLVAAACAAAAWLAGVAAALERNHAG